MATYKVWIKVKNSAGVEKEVDGGFIDVGVSDLTPETLAQLEQKLSLKDYLKISDISTELATFADFATDVEVAEATQNTVRYGDFIVKDEVGN